MNYGVISPDELDKLSDPIGSLFQIRKAQDGSFDDIFGFYPRECNSVNPPVFINFGMNDQIEVGDLLFNAKVGELTVKSVEMKYLVKNDPATLQQFAYVQSPPLTIRADVPCRAPNT